MYEELNRQARALGGYYSSYRRDGAIPGFIFKTREPAEKFVEAVRVTLGDSPAENPKPEPAPVIAPTIQPPAPVNPPPVAVRKDDWRQCFR